MGRSTEHYTDNKNVVNKRYAGYLSQKAITVEINYTSGKYNYNGTELIHIKNDVFLIPNSGFTKITFNQNEYSNQNMIINDNGIIMNFTKIK